MPHGCSHSADGNIPIIIEETESVYVENLSYAHGIEYSHYESPGMQKTYFANALFEGLCTSRHVLTAIFCPHTSACISESASFHIFCSPIPVLSNGTSFVQLRGGG